MTEQLLQSMAYHLQGISDQADKIDKITQTLAERDWSGMTHRSQWVQDQCLANAHKKIAKLVIDLQALL